MCFGCEHPPSENSAHDVPTQPFSLYAVCHNIVQVYNLRTDRHEPDIPLQMADGHQVDAVMAGRFVVRATENFLQVFDRELRLLRQLDEPNVNSWWHHADTHCEPVVSEGRGREQIAFFCCNIIQFTSLSSRPSCIIFWN